MKKFGKKLASWMLTVLMLTALLGMEYWAVPARAASAAVIPGSSLPRIYVTITDPNYHGGLLNKDMGYVSATVEVVDPSGQSSDLVDTEAVIKVRGNSTAGGAKRPYNVKLSSKKNVLGMGKGKKWCLLANMFDKSLLRNKLAYDFAENIGMEFVPATKYVDLWVNGVYVGNYLLSEPIEAKENRVDIDVDNGDYLFERERERYEQGVTYFTTRRYGMRFVTGDPEELTDAQMADLMSRLDQVETAIASNDYDTMAQYMNLDSFVDFYITQEFFKNADADYSSTRFYFKGGILYAGPVWDFDLSCGNCSSDYADYNNLSGSGNSYESFYVSSAVWNRYLFKNTTFVEKVKERYQALQPQIVNLYEDNELGTNRMDRLLAENGPSFEANWTVWSENSKDSSMERIPDATFEQNVAYLRNWLKLRNEWLLNAFADGTAILPVPNLVDGVYTLGCAQNPTEKLEISGGSAGDGTVLAPANETPGQMFVVQKMDGAYTLRSMESDCYLGVSSDSAAVVQQSVEGTIPDSCRWVFTASADGAYSIAPKSNTNLRLGVSGAKIQLQQKTGEDTQKWIPAAQNVLTDGVYRMQTRLNDSYALAVQNNATNNGANVCISTGTASQFAVESTDDGYYSIRALHSNNYLNVSGVGQTDGTNVIQYNDATIPDNQKWTALPNLDGSYSFVSLCNGLYLDVNGGTVSNGNNVQCWTGNQTDAQKWVPQAQAVLQDGVYQLADLNNPALVIAMDASRTIMGSGGAQSRIIVQQDNDGAYTLRFAESNEFLGMPDAGRISGTLLTRGRDCAEQQRWNVLTRRDGSYAFVNRSSNLYLDRTDAADPTGADLLGRRVSSSNGQSWTLLPTTVGLDGVYTIAPSGSGSYCLDAQTAKLQITQMGEAENRWILQSREDSYYVLRSMETGKLLSASGSGNGAEVRQGSAADQPDQSERWQLIPNRDGSYSLIHMATGLYLDLSNNNLSSGSRVQLWQGSDVPAQKWLLTARHAVLADGSYPVQPAGSRTQALSLGQSMNLVPFTNGENQHFEISHTEDGYYTLRYKETNVYLTGGEGNTLWTLLPNSDGSYCLVDRQSGHSLAITESGIQLAPANGTIAQRWISGAHMHRYTAKVVEPTCTEAGYTLYTCNDCGDTYQDARTEPKGHSPETVMGFPATCTTDGLHDGERCSVCGITLKQQEVIPAAHTPVVVPAVEPTCTSYGLSEGKYCSVCGQTLVSQTVIPGGHQMVADPAVPATCIQEGKTAGAHCSRCGEVFTQQQAIPKTDHKPVPDAAVAATCTASGLTEGSHCEVCGTVFVQQLLVPAQSHQYLSNRYGADENGEGGYMEYVCQLCGDTYREELPECPSRNYTDVGAKTWYHQDVDFMVQNQYMIGVSATRFGTRSELTRGQLVTILYRLTGSPSVESLPNPFYDAKAGTYYFDAVRWAYHEGVVNGVSETSFQPNRSITRQEIAAILCRYDSAQPQEQGSLNRFPDADRVSNYARGSMAWAVEKGYINGSKQSDGTILLKPTHSATRAECAAILCRYLKDVH